MIDVNTEDLLTLGQARKLLPGPPRHIHDLAVATRPRLWWPTTRNREDRRQGLHHPRSPQAFRPRRNAGCRPRSEKPGQRPTGQAGLPLSKKPRRGLPTSKARRRGKTRTQGSYMQHTDSPEGPPAGDRGPQQIVAAMLNARRRPPLSVEQAADMIQRACRACAGLAPNPRASGSSTASRLRWRTGW